MEVFFSLLQTAPDRGKWGRIDFSTNNDELFRMVSNYMQVCVDAMSWRNRIERIGKTIETSGADDE